MATPKMVKGDQYLLGAMATPKAELWSGELTRRMPQTADYCGLVGRICAYIGGYAVPRGLGEVFASECAFITDLAAEKLLMPDVAFVRADRLAPWPERPAILDVAPDLAVLIAYPRYRHEWAHERAPDFLEAGSAAVWLVDPLQVAVTVQAAGQEPVVVAADGELDGGDVLPGFRVGVRELLGTA